MRLVVMVVAGLLCTAATASPNSSAEDPLLDRMAQLGIHLEQPDSMHEIKREIERCFGLQLSIEPLPEQCSGARASDMVLDPFKIVKGDQLGQAIARLEAASAGRWVFEEFHGVPLLRPDHAVAGQGTLLGTVIDVEIDVRNLWDALCALALTVNSKNSLEAFGQRPMIIMFLAPTLMRHPPKLFTEEKPIRVTISNAPAREGLCAILAAAGENVRYFYTCVAEGNAPDYDYVTVTAFDGDGKPLRGGRFGGAEDSKLLKSADWMSDKRILAVQAPGYNPDGE